MRSGVLLVAIISPALLGTQFRCVAVSGPTVATARIERIEPITPRVGDIVHFTIGDVASRGLIPNACTVDRDTTYYLNVVFASARDGLAPGENVCREGITLCGWRWNIE